MVTPRRPDPLEVVITKEEQRDYSQDNFTSGLRDVLRRGKMVESFFHAKHCEDRNRIFSFSLRREIASAEKTALHLALRKKGMECGRDPGGRSG